MDLSKVEIYNSVFKAVNCPAPSMTYNNSGQVKVKVYNSVFDLETNMVNSYTGANSNTQIINSASTHTFANDANYYSNNLENITLDENYNIISNGWQNAGIGLNYDGSAAHIGVYGGEDAWDQTNIPEASNIIMLAIGSIALWIYRRK